MKECQLRLFEALTSPLQRLMTLQSFDQTNSLMPTLRPLILNRFGLQHAIRESSTLEGSAAEVERVLGVTGAGVQALYRDEKVRVCVCVCVCYVVPCMVERFDLLPFSSSLEEYQ